jgi:hypothetical protein
MNPLRYVHSWQTVALVGVVCAFVGGIFHFADADGKAALLGVLCVLGTTAAAIARQAFAVPPPAAPKRIELPRDEDDDDPGAGGEVLADGPPTVPQRRSSARHTMLTVIGGLALSTLSACSPSALQTHATVALVASHTLEVTRASALATCTALRDTCRADLACIEHTRADCLAVADAQDATVAAVAVYVDSIELAALADEGRVMEALRFALEAASRAWDSLGERLAAVGIALPSLGGAQ